MTDVDPRSVPMQRTAMYRIPRPLTSIALAVAIAAFAVPAAAGAGQAPTKHVVDKAQNTSLGETILVNTKHHTLYSLSVEKHGKFTCTGSCTSTWHPLIVRAGVKPTGPVKLGTVVRPEGKTQVTFKGRPLYSFNGDSKAGDANGEGFKDVGTWHAAEVSKIAKSPSPSPPPENPYPY
jgi:predicted lipoprotein with Yx(FWY)xxD motif